MVYTPNMKSKIRHLIMVYTPNMKSRIRHLIMVYTPNLKSRIRPLIMVDFMCNTPYSLNQTFYGLKGLFSIDSFGFHKSKMYVNQHKKD